MDLFTICFTFFNLGFFGGFLHCTSMCSPFVIHQISGKLKNTKIEDFQGLKKIFNLSLTPYHLGRITTYSIIGFCCSYTSNKVFSSDNFSKVSAIALMAGATVMLLTILFDSKYFSKFTRLPLLLIKLLPNFQFFKSFVSILFNNPTSIRGYLLGIILGFLPCGLLYSAFALTLSIQSPILALLAMAIFGLATFPALFLVGITSYKFLNIKNFNIKLIARLVILINCVTIYIIAINLLTK